MTTPSGDEPRATARARWLSVGVACMVFAASPCGGARAEDGRPLGELGAPGETTNPTGGLRTLVAQIESFGVPGQDLTRLVDAARRMGFTESELCRVFGLVVRAQLAGLPHGALLSKIREGLAKGAVPEAIDRALENKAQVLREAKRLTDTLLVEGWTAPDYPLSIQAVADALEAGAAPQDVLASVRQGNPLWAGGPDVRGVFRIAPVRR